MPHVVHTQCKEYKLRVYLGHNENVTPLLTDFIIECVSVRPCVRPSVAKKHLIPDRIGIRRRDRREYAVEYGEEPNVP